MERIQLRRDISTKWTEINPILMEGEVGFETDTKLRKIGDGVTPWNNLDYLAAENIVQELGDSITATVSQNAITENFGNYIENEEFIRAYIDNTGKFLFGIRRDGTIEWVKGIPYIIESAINSKVTTQENKDLIDVDFSESAKSIDSNEYLNLITDNSNKPLFWIDKDGSIGWHKGVPQPVKEYIKDHAQKQDKIYYTNINFQNINTFSEVINITALPDDSLVVKMDESLSNILYSINISFYYEDSTVKVINTEFFTSTYFKFNNNSEKTIVKAHLTIALGAQASGNIQIFNERAYGTFMSIQHQNKILKHNQVFKDDFDDSDWTKNWDASFNFKDRSITSNNSRFNWSNYDNLPQLIYCEDSVLHIKTINKELLPNPSLYPMTYVGGSIYGRKSLLLYEGIIRVKAKVIYDKYPNFTSGIWTLTKNQIQSIDSNGVATLYNWPQLVELDILETSLSKINAAYVSTHLINDTGTDFNSRRVKYQDEYVSWGYKPNEWHVYSMELKNGKVAYYIDEHFVYELDMKKVSSKNITVLEALHLFTNAKSSSASVELINYPVELQIDWVEAYALDEIVKAQSFTLQAVKRYVDNIVYPKNITYSNGSIRSITIKKDERFVIHPIFEPINSTNQACNFKVNNNNIAIVAPDRNYSLREDININFHSIEDFYICGIAVGSTTVTCTCADGLIQTFEVIVIE